MEKRYWEQPVCILCDYWWLLLILLAFGVGGWLLWSRLSSPVLGEGDVQFTLQWENTNDLDLHVISPTGQHLYYEIPRSNDGGQLDVDSNAGCNNLSWHPVENIYWPIDGAPEGEYHVWVEYYQQCQSDFDTSYTVTLKVDEKKQTVNGQIRHRGEKKDVMVIIR